MKQQNGTCEFKKGLEGNRVILTDGASWTNYNCPPVHLAPGTAVYLQSWRPEGYTAVTDDGTATMFFVFAKYLKTATIANY